jgi:AraC-like DNA-binding protein
MHAMGMDVQRVYQRCGISDDMLVDHQARTPHSAQRNFWQVLEQESGDSLIGLRLACSIPLYHGQILAYLFLSSVTFGEGLERVLRYRRLISDAVEFQLDKGEPRSQLHISFSEPADDVLRHRDEIFMGYIVRYFKVLTEGDFRATRVSFCHEAYASSEQYHQLLDCEVQFGQDKLILEFESDCLAKKSTHSDPDLLAMHEQLAQRRLAGLEKADIVESVRQFIGQTLEQGQPELSDAAAALELPVRALRSQLAEAKTTFNEIVADHRFSLARHLLAKTDESIAEIVYLTGFSEPSTFYRAFKRWSGVTPLEYRQRKRRQSER